MSIFFPSQNKPYQEKLAWIDGQVQTVKDEQRKKARDVQAAFVAHRQPISPGEIADKGDRTFANGSIPIAVKAG